MTHVVDEGLEELVEDVVGLDRALHSSVEVLGGYRVLEAGVLEGGEWMVVNGWW